MAEELPLKAESMHLEKQRLKWWKDKIGFHFLSAITMVMVNDLKSLLKRERKNEKGEPVSGATISRYLSSLSVVLSTARRKWFWTDRNPVENASRGREPRGRVRFLSDDERKALLAACEKSSCSYLNLIVALALSPGMRKEEIRNLTWNDIDLTEGTILLQKTKNRERRRDA